MKGVKGQYNCHHVGGNGLCEKTKRGACKGYFQAYFQRRWRDPKYRAARAADFLQRYHHDPNFKKKCKEWTNKAGRKRYHRLRASDPEFRKKHAERVNKYRATGRKATGPVEKKK